MKYLGNVKVTLLKERQKYKELFSPLSETPVMRTCAREHQGGGQILNYLILERSEEGYLTPGHHRKAIAQELGLERFPAPSRKHAARYSRRLR